MFCPAAQSTVLEDGPFNNYSFCLVGKAVVATKPIAAPVTYEIGPRLKNLVERPSPKKEEGACGCTQSHLHCTSSFLPVSVIYIYLHNAPFSANCIQYFLVRLIAYLVEYLYLP
ncbi:uncharacterized protein LOC131319072 [Rhododendron vialii]|uniref:uncharacterized protein LOC131319072 n=1 Tax=Rhododendron vialii TaxID=182163 RepID=UPI00265F18AA|nr:uncharacterized protein LOC131319072 [Rhododendron vialii]